MKNTILPTEEIKNYYGRLLKTTKDLKTSACCIMESSPAHILNILREIEPEILERFYGCGSPIPASDSAASTVT